MRTFFLYISNIFSHLLNKNMILQWLQKNLSILDIKLGTIYIFISEKEIFLRCFREFSKQLFYDYMFLF